MTATIRTHAKGWIVVIRCNGRFVDQHVYKLFQSAITFAELVMKG
jgi:hypothetical protein